MEGKDEEQRKELEEQLEQADNTPGPFERVRPLQTELTAPANPNIGKLQAMPAPNKPAEPQPQPEPESEGYSEPEVSDFETGLRRVKRTPSWYKGEEGAYKYAKVAMKGVASIPKS